ncbi:MAG: IS21 family transposase [Oligoflexus sp.]|nr:IS21 family transposase [Oligoflexus sp.]
MIDPELRATIRRLHFNQQLTVNAVSEVLAIHHDTVLRAIARNVEKAEVATLRELNLFEAKMIETLELYPKISATRIHLMLKEHGFKGGVRSVQRWLRGVRPRVKARIFAEMSVLPGEQAQVDWAHFGTLEVGKAKRKLSAFVMVLSYSRAIFVRFTFDQTVETLLFCHSLAFENLGGVPRTILYDNMRTVVADRIGKEYRFQNDFINFCAHYPFEPKVCMPYQPQSKGRVERTIRYLRENFFEGRMLTDLNRLNDEVREWCTKTATLRRWPEDKSFCVRDKFFEESSALRTQPNQEFSYKRTVIVKADAYGFVLFDRNRYSIPPSAMGRYLTLKVGPEEIDFYEEAHHICAHLRC